MNWRVAALVIPLAVATSAATTATIMLYQAGRFVDRLADSLMSPTECASVAQDDCIDEQAIEEQLKHVIESAKGRPI